MGKEKELNPRQRKYCILRAAGTTQIDAYKAAGYKVEKKTGKGHNNASMLEKKKIDEIRRIQDRQEEKSFDLARVCQGFAPEAIQELAGLLRQKKAPQVKVRAIQEMLDRGFGKPRETIDTGVVIKWDIGISPPDNKQGAT